MNSSKRQCKSAQGSNNTAMPNCPQPCDDPCDYKGPSFGYVLFVIGAILFLFAFIWLAYKAATFSTTATLLEKVVVILETFSLPVLLIFFTFMIAMIGVGAHVVSKKHKVDKCCPPKPVCVPPAPVCFPPAPQRVVEYLQPLPQVQPIELGTNVHYDVGVIH